MGFIQSCVYINVEINYSSKSDRLALTELVIPIGIRLLILASSERGHLSVNV